MKRALLVGIDDYVHHPLTGCVADAEAMAAVLERNEDGSQAPVAPGPRHHQAAEFLRAGEAAQLAAGDHRAVMLDHPELRRAELRRVEPGRPHQGAEEA